MSTLPLILIFFILLSSSAKSACEPGYFSKSSTCDTKATRVQCKEFTSVRAYGWHYFYIPLHRSEGNIELEFKVYEPGHSVYINFQSADSEKLPNTFDLDDFFYIENYGKDIYSKSFANRNEEVMVLGFKKSDFIIEADMEVRYYTEHGDCKRSANKTLIIIIGASIGVFIFTGSLFCCLFRKARRQRNAMSEQNNENRTDPEAQVILDHNKIPDFLTLEDLQKYFPKSLSKTSKIHSSKQEFISHRCSICLEDFGAETICHQLYCNHIFHEICAQNWLEKYHNCPGCRVPIGKRQLKSLFKSREK